MKRWRRTFAIVRGLLPFVIAFVRDRRRYLFFGGGRRVSPEQQLRRAQRLTNTIAHLGPTFVKLAQVFSARADILPDPYLTEIGRLQDQMPPYDPAEIEAVIRAELGQDINVLFDSFEREA